MPGWTTDGAGIGYRGVARKNHEHQIASRGERPPGVLTGLLRSPIAYRRFKGAVLQKEDDFPRFPWMIRKRSGAAAEGREEREEYGWSQRECPNIAN